MRLFRFLLGLAIGAGVGLLFAPKSGRELRRQLIGDASGKLLNAASDDDRQPEAPSWGAPPAGVEAPVTDRVPPPLEPAPVTSPSATAEVVVAEVAPEAAPATEPGPVAEPSSWHAPVEEPIGEDLRRRIEETRAALQNELAQPFAREATGVPGVSAAPAEAEPDVEAEQIPKAEPMAEPEPIADVAAAPDQDAQLADPEGSPDQSDTEPTPYEVTASADEADGATTAVDETTARTDEGAVAADAAIAEAAVFEVAAGEAVAAADVEETVTDEVTPEASPAAEDPFAEPPTPPPPPLETVTGTSAPASRPAEDEAAPASTWEIDEGRATDATEGAGAEPSATTWAAEKPATGGPSVEEPIADEPPAEAPPAEEPFAGEPLEEDAPTPPEPALEEPIVSPDAYADEPVAPYEHDVTKETPAVEAAPPYEPVVAEEPAVVEPVAPTDEEPVVAPAADEPTPVTEEPSTPVGESPPPSVEEQARPFEQQPVAAEPAAEQPPVGERAAETADATRSQAYSPREGASIDQAEMRRRIEETRARLKAKAFDAMMSGEAALLARDSGEKPVPKTDDHGLDEATDSAIDESLSQEDY